MSKGSWQRPGDREAYRRGWSRIFGRRKVFDSGGLTVWDNGDMECSARVSDALERSAEHLVDECTQRWGAEGAAIDLLTGSPPNSEDFHTESGTCDGPRRTAPVPLKEWMRTHYRIPDDD